MPTPNVISVISTGGGTGKTTTALALASYWPKPADVLLVDCDQSQDTKCLRFWLQHADPGPKFDHHPPKTDDESVPDAASIEQVLASLPSVTYPTVIVDTPPRVDTTDVRRLAAASDLVIATGRAAEIDAIVATVRNIQASAPHTTIRVVLTLHRTSAHSQEFRESIDSQLSDLVRARTPILGTIPLSNAMERARVTGRLPTDLGDSDAQAKLAEAMKQTVKNTVKALK